jgi:hypothetical protein
MESLVLARIAYHALHSQVKNKLLLFRTSRLPKGAMVGPPISEKIEENLTPEFPPWSRG